MNWRGTKPARLPLAGVKTEEVVEEPADEGTTKELYRLIYTSSATPPGQAAGSAAFDLQGIGRRAQTQNETLGISGALILVRGYIIQVLEGNRTELEVTFERICCDLRHSGISLIDFSPIQERRFSKWSMNALDSALTRDPEHFEDLLMSVSAGMAPANIAQELQYLIGKEDEAPTGDRDQSSPAASSAARPAR